MNPVIPWLYNVKLTGTDQKVKVIDEAIRQDVQVFADLLGFPNQKNELRCS